MQRREDTMQKICNSQKCNGHIAERTYVCRTPCLLFQNRNPKHRNGPLFRFSLRPMPKCHSSSSKSLQPHQCNSLQLKQYTQLTQEEEKTQQTNNRYSRNPKNDNVYRQQCLLELETDDLWNHSIQMAKSIFRLVPCDSITLSITHVLTAASKFLWACCSTKLSDNFQWKCKISFSSKMVLFQNFCNFGLFFQSAVC